MYTTQVVINWQYSVVQLCTSEDALAYILGTSPIDDIASYNSLTTICFFLVSVEETKKMKIGNPLDRSTAHGPQNHKAHLDKLVGKGHSKITVGWSIVFGLGPNHSKSEHSKWPL